MTSLSTRRACARALITGVLLAAPAGIFAWGRAGHEAIAVIAQDRLSPAAQAWVRGILAGEDIGTAAAWPDTISHWRKETGPWHYIDLPIQRSGAAGHWKDYCGGQGCVMSALIHFEAVLRDPQALPAQRKEALRFVLHLVADLHQPLHCADDDDRGGNDKPVYGRGRLNLHQLFDDALLSHRRVRAALLEGYIQRELAKPAVLAEAGQGSLQAWMAQSAGLARENIYPLYKLRQGRLSREDITSWQPLVDQQLARACVRLGLILEELAIPGKKP